MNRRFGWALLVAVGMVLGFMSSSYQRTSAGAPAEPAADAEATDADAIVQLKEIKAQLKEINTMFRTGTARVIVVINPSKP